MTEKFCHGVQLSGGRRGAPCQARPVYQVRGKDYCVPHSAIAAKEPVKFRQAMETAVRRQVRHDAAARARSAQIDAFEELTAAVDAV